MATKKEQQKVGRPVKPRGQEMGRTGNPDKNREEMKDTPALSGRRKRASKMFADESSQHVASDASKPKSNQPSVPAAMPARRKLGESGGEREFKARGRKRK